MHPYSSRVCKTTEVKVGGWKKSYILGLRLWVYSNLNLNARCKQNWYFFDLQILPLIFLQPLELKGCIIWKSWTEIHWIYLKKNCNSNFKDVLFSFETVKAWVIVRNRKKLCLLLSEMDWSLCLFWLLGCTREHPGVLAHTTAWYQHCTGEV